MYSVVFGRPAPWRLNVPGPTKDRWAEVTELSRACYFPGSGTCPSIWDLSLRHSVLRCGAVKVRGEALMAAKKKSGSGPKPGAMTMAMKAVDLPQSGPKALRLGLMKDGKITVTKIIRERETVTVGRSENNHIIIAGNAIPPSFALFEVVGRDYILNFKKDTGGRVALSQGVKELSELVSTGAARNAGDHWQVKLSDQSRGRIDIGDYRLLFQFVDPPAPAPKPHLPATVRTGFGKSVDWLFTTCLVLAYMFFFMFIIYLEYADWPYQGDDAEIPAALAGLVRFEEPPEPEVPVEEEVTEEEGETEEVAENTKSSSGKSSNDSGEPSAGENLSNDAEARTRLADDIASTVAAAFLTAAGEGGAFADLLKGDGAATGDLAAALANTGGIDANGSAGTFRGRTGGGGSGEGGKLGALKSQGGGKAKEGGTVTERRVRGTIKTGSGGDIGGTGDFDSNLVQREIKKRLRAIKTCYEKALKTDPTLAGKVAVEFTIEQRGTVSGARAVENTSGSPALATCITSTVKRFRFNPGPTGGSVKFKYPFVFSPQN